MTHRAQSPLRTLTGFAFSIMAALLVFSSGCAGEVGPYEEECVEGRTVECACPDGTASAQVCADDGTWGVCQCAASADAGFPDASSGGADADSLADAQYSADAASPDASTGGQPDAASPDTGADTGGSECNLPDPPGDRIVNLADEGLQPGDEIDGYLEAYVEDGVELHIPAGTYRWNGTFPPTLDNSSIIGDGEVIWDAGDGWDFSGNFTASGDAEIRNITIKGKCNGDGKFRAIARNPGDTLTLRNFWMPDGCYTELERSGFYIPSSHEGTLKMIDCRIERFPNNGFYASSATGPVHVIGGLYRNNNIANVRLGSSDSMVKEVVIMNDDLSPENEFGQRNQRGLRIRESGDNITVEDVSITQLVGGQPIQIHREANGSGTLRRVRIRNDESSTAINVANGDWTGSDIDLTGSGDLDISGESFDDVCRGDQCDAPSTTPRPFCRQ